ncbi:Dyp-type peroxidase [Salinibacterium sp. ZJ70]|uniref:Dyp-type peroxidase n=1 Tax=Salinibacterium sp. ZJ70 TaxID=2708084 RepID=UPI0014220D05|nr:Dyp-type peroxidase [Salinibacterium sp. ZJ70]
MSEETRAAGAALTRRALLTGAGVAGVAAAGTFAVQRLAHTPAVGVDGASAVSAHGLHQAGIDRPELPQRHSLVAVLDVDRTRLQQTLKEVGVRIERLTASPNGLPDVTPDGPGDLTVTVGLGSDALGATAHPELAALVDLPTFAGDDGIAEERRGGDVLLSIGSSDPSVLDAALAALLDVVDEPRVRWREHGFRSAPVDGVARNTLGYHDGIVGPRGAEVDASVWISEGPLAGGSIAVLRRLRVDADAFRRLAPEARDAVIGREQSSGAPLSGGLRDDDIDLGAKAPDGRLMVPSDAHARAAHPSFTGSGLMLRRSYGYLADSDQGHLFVSFQNDIRTFVRTQLRLDETDALMRFVTPSASGAFAILPGATAERPLGGTLF